MNYRLKLEAKGVSIRFEDLDSGDVFRSDEHDGCFLFMKLDSHDPNAVCLTDGETETFSEDLSVAPACYKVVNYG